MEPDKISDMLWIPTGQTIWIADAHRGDGKRFIVGADAKLPCVYGTRIGDLRLAAEPSVRD
jgi:hypothetical protein